MSSQKQKRGKIKREMKREQRKSEKRSIQLYGGTGHGPVASQSVLPRKKIMVPPPEYDASAFPTVFQVTRQQLLQLFRASPETMDTVLDIVGCPSDESFNSETMEINRDGFCRDNPWFHGLFGPEEFEGAVDDEGRATDAWLERLLDDAIHCGMKAQSNKI